MDWKDKEYVLNNIRNGRSLSIAPLELRNDREVVLAAIEDKDYAIEFASEELKNDKEFILPNILKQIFLFGHLLFFYPSCLLLFFLDS